MAKVKLNSLDREVKRMMLNYPSLFPSRLEALHHLFCVNGNGYRWKDGVLEYPSRRPGSKNPRKIELEEPKEILMRLMPDQEKLRIEYTNMLRLFTEKHINELCSGHQYLNSELTFVSVYPMSWDYCAIGYAADHRDEIDPDWRNGIVEFIHWYLQAANSSVMIHGRDYDKSIEEHAATDVRNNYQICKKALGMLRTPEEQQRLTDALFQVSKIMEGNK